MPACAASSKHEGAAGSRSTAGRRSASAGLRCSLTWAHYADSRMVLAALLLSIVIMRLPAVFGDDVPMWAFAAPLLVFGGLSVLLAVARPRLHARPAFVAIYGIYMALIVVSFFRAAFAGTLLDLKSATLLALENALFAVFCALALL